MTNPLEDTQVLNAEEVAELTGEAEEQDETGAPEKVAETEWVPIESFDAIRQPGDESSEDVSHPTTDTPDEQDRAPQPGNTPAPDEPPRDGGTITRETQDTDD